MVLRLKHRRELVVLSALLLLALPSWASQVLVYAQNPNYVDLFASQNDTATALNFTSYDNFTLGSATTITQAEWVGGYYNPQIAGAIGGWTVVFYSDNAGQPGGILTSFFFLGNGGETPLGTDSLGDPVFLYSSPLISFSAAAGTTYWMSVVPDLPFPPQWGWTSSSQGDGVSYTDDFLGNRFQNSTDLSFALFATQSPGVPEPGTLTMLASGIVGSLGIFRRRRKQ